jgi:hypothetical protein
MGSRRGAPLRAGMFAKAASTHGFAGNGAVFHRPRGGGGAARREGGAKGFRKNRIFRLCFWRE